MQETSVRTGSTSNLIFRLGVWLTVAAALLWAGGRAITYIERYLPYAGGIGIGLIVVGMLIQSRRKKQTANIAQRT